MVLDTQALVAGGVAGFAVDVSLFPIDTIKTRLQSPAGFLKSGGFKGIYKGLGSAAVGSVPGAALFFVSYESAKPAVQSALGLGENSPVSHMGAASLGEAMACIARVPTENVKQNLQANVYKSTGEALRGIVQSRGVSGFYTGYGTTLMREIPFSLIQFPLWEALKQEVGRRRGDGSVLPVESAAAGSVSGAFAAALTTPLDVIKTRLMLGVDAKGVKYNGMLDTGKRIVDEEGAGALLKGIQPRVMWIGIGGFVFFFAYQSTRDFLVARNETDSENKKT